MRDVAGLMHLAFKLSHDLSDACLDMDREPGLRAHRVHATLIADGGVSALAHVAAASMSYSAGTFRSKTEAAESLRGARAELQSLKQRLTTVRHLGLVADERAEPLAKRIDELIVILMALAVEIRGNHMVA